MTSRGRALHVRIKPHSVHRFPAPSTKFCQNRLRHWRRTLHLFVAVHRRYHRKILPELVTPLKENSSFLCSCPPTLSPQNYARTGYATEGELHFAAVHRRYHRKIMPELVTPVKENFTSHLSTDSITAKLCQNWLRQWRRTSLRTCPPTLSPQNYARTGYASEGELHFAPVHRLYHRKIMPELVTPVKENFTSHLSTDAISALRKVWVLIRLWKQHSAQTHTLTRGAPARG